MFGTECQCVCIAIRFMNLISEKFILWFYQYICFKIWDNLIIYTQKLAVKTSVFFLNCKEKHNYLVLLIPTTEQATKIAFHSLLYITELFFVYNPFIHSSWRFKKINFYTKKVNLIAKLKNNRLSFHITYCITM